MKTEIKLQFFEFIDSLIDTSFLFSIALFFSIIWDDSTILEFAFIMFAMGMFLIALLVILRRLWGKDIEKLLNQESN
jgi:hypothetical protein